MPAAPTREPLSGHVSQLALALARRLDQGCAPVAYTVPADAQCARSSSPASTRGPLRPRRFRGSAPGAAAVGSGRQQAEQSAAPRRPSMRRRWRSQRRDQLQPPAERARGRTRMALGARGGPPEHGQPAIEVFRRQRRCAAPSEVGASGRATSATTTGGLPCHEARASRSEGPLEPAEPKVAIAANGVALVLCGVSAEFALS